MYYSFCWTWSSKLAAHVDECERTSGNRSLRSAAGGQHDRKEPAMKWMTRERAKVDRIACPWLISRFIDPQPEFLYVPTDQVLTEAATQEAIPYDIPNVELGHQGPLCSFDALMAKFALQGTDPALDRVALIVRGADTADKDLTPESRGLDAIAGGFQQMGLSDHEKLEKEFPVYDALYVYCGGTLPIPQPSLKEVAV
jgi:hypothetical protein